ncbi:MAG: hypothetical protein H0X50_09300, partial [Nitrosopumilus sp.]|nr:hypothetical protein [Nitrosopumilus sp.]
DDDDKSDSSKGKGSDNHDDDDKSDSSKGKGGRNSADQGIDQDQSSKQSAKCIDGGSIDVSCNNVIVQADANTGNVAAAQDGGGDGNGKSDSEGGRNSADQGIDQDQSSKQSSQCVAGGDIGTSCNNIGVQAQANTGNLALGQQGGNGEDGGGENSADQGIDQDQSSKQSHQCVAGGSIDVSCNNVIVQAQANTGNVAAAQDGGGDGNGKSDNEGENSADQGIYQDQSSEQESQCVSGEDAIVSCNNVAFQNKVNSGNTALGLL